MSLEFLWYLPNTVEPGHRGDTATSDDGAFRTTDKTSDDSGWRREDFSKRRRLIGRSRDAPRLLRERSSIARERAFFSKNSP